MAVRSPRIGFRERDDLNFQLSHTFEFLDNAFEISDGIDILPGDYGNWEWELRGRSASRRIVSVNGNLRGRGLLERHPLRL